MVTKASWKEGGQTQPREGVDGDTAQHEKSQNRTILFRATRVRELKKYLL
jgi:hypothetical protein